MPIHINHFGLQITLAIKGERAFCNVKVVRYDLDVEGSSYQKRISIFFSQNCGSLMHWNGLTNPCDFIPSFHLTVAFSFCSCCLSFPVQVSPQMG